MLSVTITNQDNTTSTKPIAEPESIRSPSLIQSHRMAEPGVAASDHSNSAGRNGQSSLSEYSEYSQHQNHLLRHDEQACEEHYDDRSEAHDDVEKQKIKFSHTKLYGRDNEVQRLFDVFDGMMMTKKEREQDRYHQISSPSVPAPAAGPTASYESRDSIGESNMPSPGVAEESDGMAQIVFLPGYSGTGKSSLVQEFIKQLRKREKQEDEESKVDYTEEDDDPQFPTTSSVLPPSPKAARTARRIRPRYICGKHQELAKAANPYSAIAEGLNKYFKSLYSAAKSKLKNSNYHHAITELETIRKSVQDALGDYGATLAEIIPNLSNILYVDDCSMTERTSTNDDEGEGDYGPSSANTEGLENDTDEDDCPIVSTKSYSDRANNKTGEMVKHLFRNVISSLCTEERPLILFLDDLQWMDECSADLLSSLLSDETLRYFMFIGAYRSNEVLEQDHRKQQEQQSQESKDDGVAVDTVGGSSRSSSFVSSILSDLTNNGRRFEQIDLSELKYEDITEFVADTLSLHTGKVRPLSRAVFNKTLGNIFFTMQALEELVLRNGLYYDVMFFKWEWNIGQLEMESLLSDDIVQMVQFKIQNLEPAYIQHLLTVASYTRSTVTIETMTDVMNVVEAASVITHPEPTQKVYDKEMIERYLDKAVEKGLLAVNNPRLHQGRLGTGDKSNSRISDSKEYTFAHDRIQEAAREFVNGVARERLCFHLAQELNRRYCGNGEDWMLFTAVSHMNALPDTYFEKDLVAMAEKRHNGSWSICDDDNSSKSSETVSLLYLARLNLRAAEAAIGRSAFRQAVEFLQRGTSALDENYANNPAGEVGNLKWRYQYELCLELFNHLLESEFAIGDREGAQKAIDEVLEHATKRSGHDKLLAQFMAVEIIYTLDRDFDKVLETGLGILARHNIKIPMKPSAARIAKEMLGLQLAMGPRRTLIDLLKEPHMDEYHEQVMRFMPQLSKAALLSGRNDLTTLINLTAQKLSWEQGFNEHLPTMLPNYGSVLRRQGKLKEAVKVAVATEQLLKNICHGPTWCRGMHMWGGALSPICARLAYCADICNDVHREAIACGEGYTALLSAMIYSLSYYSAGLPMNAVFEAKMALFLRECKSLALTPTLTVTFRIFHQTTLNLQGKGNTANPVKLAGRSLDEEKVLSEFDGPAKKQTFRDISVFRLMLACVYYDEAAMEELLQRFESYPEIDLCFPRHHLRDVFMGLAAFHLSRKYQKQNRQLSKKFSKIGKQKQASVQQLAKLAKSENAPPVLACFRAVETPSKSNYIKAIDAARASGMIHLEAIMNEWYGLYLVVESGKNDGKNNNNNTSRVSSRRSGISTEAEAYITDAMWAYFDWGALGKVKHMRQDYKFLLNAHRDASKMFKLP